MKTETLKSLHKRATIAASAVVAGLVVVSLAYLIAVEKGALPSVSKPLVQKPAQLVDSNPPVAKAVTVAAAPVPKPVASVPAPTAKAPASASKAASSLTTTKPAVADPKPAANHLTTTTPPPARVSPFNVVTNITAEDERVARRWLDDTNQRPAIRVRYQPADIVRLTTELNRGLFVAGNGTTNRRELFLQYTSQKSPMFNPFTKSVAQRFADYTLALNSSPAFERLTAPLPAYFPDGDFDLAFVPDRVLAELMFTHIARASRRFHVAQLSAGNPVFEGNLTLVGSEPVFEIEAVRCEEKQPPLATETLAPVTLPRTGTTSTPRAAQ